MVSEPKINNVPTILAKLVVAQGTQKGPRIEKMDGLYRKNDNITVQNDQKCSKIKKRQPKMVKNGKKNCQNSFQAIYIHNKRS